ncbi:MAG: hypothetical protein WCW67_05685 [Candidatus Margulisiibacteriota bacterium]|jgi:predicted acyltransferase (DUF342 family)
MKRKGVTLIAVMFIILALTIFVVSLTSLFFAGSNLAVRGYFSLKTFFIACAGQEYYLNQLSQDTDWTTPPLAATRAFNGGFFRIAITDAANNQITVTVTGVLTVEGVSYSRVIRSALNRSVGGFINYPLYFAGSPSGDGTTNIGNNVIINGDIFFNANVSLGANTTVNGDLSSSGSITGSTTEVNGTVTPNTPTPEGFPQLDTTYYDMEIATAESQTPQNRTLSGTISGTYYVHGNLTIGNNATVNANAKLVATGWINIQNNVKIKDYVVIIGGGEVTIANNVDIGEQCVFYSSIGFTINNNLEAGTVTVGGGSVFLTPGFVNINNNCEINGFIYAGGAVNINNNVEFNGNIVGGFLNSLGSNCTITLNTTLVDYDAIIGLEGETGGHIDVTNWLEVY